MSDPSVVTIQRILETEPVSHRSTAILHALIHKRPGLWVDDQANPSTLLWLREGDGCWEAFVHGDSTPALSRIESKARGSTVALLAPDFAQTSLRAGRRGIETATIQTYIGLEQAERLDSSSHARLLTFDDLYSFNLLAPPWSLRSWEDFDSLLRKGIAVGWPVDDGLASVAWTYESTPGHDKIGVVTSPRFQRLGLGRRVASALLDRIINERRKVPIWVTSAENKPSAALAMSLGFVNPTDETLWRWTP